jgi:hypothetical protein
VYSKWVRVLDRYDTQDPMHSIHTAHVRQKCEIEIACVYSCHLIYTYLAGSTNGCFVLCAYPQASLLLFFVSKLVGWRCCTRAALHIEGAFEVANEED